jgi:hypothetical protein
VGTVSVVDKIGANPTLWKTRERRVWRRQTTVIAVRPSSRMEGAAPIVDLSSMVASYARLLEEEEEASFQLPTEVWGANEREIGRTKVHSSM